MVQIDRVLDLTGRVSGQTERVSVQGDGVSVLTRRVSGLLARVSRLEGFGGDFRSGEWAMRAGEGCFGRSTSVKLEKRAGTL